jgi:Cys-tRNA(Pro)/Cys-tRNA(Cys) deacylase
MTPAVKVLQAAKVAFTLHSYEHDPRAEAFGPETVEKLGVDAARVFKTLVAEVDGKCVFAIVPVAGRLDLKALAKAAGGKHADMADPAVAQRLTGYIVGGISPLGGKKALATFLDRSALAQTTILCSAGRRGLQVELAPADLLRLTAGQAAEIATK